MEDGRSVIKNFKVVGNTDSIKRYGNGHINDTYLVSSSDSDVRYILQRVNKNVFKKPEKVMENIIAVTEYIKNRSENIKTLSLVECGDGKKYYTDKDGDIWRVYDFIENAVSLDLPETENDFYQSAVAFGEFQSVLKSFPADKLYETILNFHNTPERYRNFLSAVKKDVKKRAKSVLPEIKFVKDRESFYSILEDSHRAGLLPLKVTHNDTKLNNVMLDEKTRTPVCVIDLDTIMPGYAVNDFGDSIRFGASTAPEDEKDLDKVHFDINLFKTYTDGFLKGCGGTLSETEINLLPVGAKMMTMECGMRFLADYLQGDVYFKTAYPEHNLDRCRTQFKLVSEMEEKWDQMQTAVKQISEKYKKG